MRTRPRAVALITAAATIIAAALALVPIALAVVAGSPPAAAAVACTAPAWAEGTSYRVGDQVTYNGHQYQALVAHTPPPGAGWNPAATPSLWKDLGACGGTPSPTTSPSRSPSPSPSVSPTRSPSPSPTGGGGATCAVKSRPGGKVLQGYWENWD